MPGPTAKPPALRQRRNRTVTRGQFTTEPATRFELPTDHNRKWHPFTVQWWNTIWSSGLSDLWTKADEPGLLQLARLVELFWRATEVREITSLESAIRLRGGRYGLSPMDRRSLQWEDMRVNAAEAAPAIPAPPAAVRDPRLRAVK